MNHKSPCAPDWLRFEGPGCTHGEGGALLCMLCGFGSRPVATYPMRPLCRPSRLASCSVQFCATEHQPPPRRAAKQNIGQKKRSRACSVLQNIRQSGRGTHPKENASAYLKTRTHRLCYQATSRHTEKVDAASSLAFHSIANQGNRKGGTSCSVGRSTRGVCPRRLRLSPHPWGPACCVHVAAARPVLSFHTHVFPHSSLPHATPRQMPGLWS